MLDETRRPIRAGLAYLRSVKDDSAAQAALQRVQGPVRLYGQAFRKATMTANAARSAVVSALCEPMQVHHRFVVAMGDALCGTRFERLHALAKQYPDLRHIADQVEQAARECQQIRREQQCELEDRLRHHQMDWSDILSTITPAIDDLEIWSSIAPLGEQDRGVVREAIREQRTPKTRMKREVAEPLIAEHLTRRPHDTVAQVADKVKCSVGVVAESTAWKVNRERLKVARQAGIDPSAVNFNARTVNAVGGSPRRQRHAARQQSLDIDAEIDERDKELSHRIGEFQQTHPDATPEQVAAAVGCTAADVERRQAALNRLVAEQADDHLEDIDVEDPITRRGTRRKWVDKRV